jgi:hypothetical protein
MDVGRQCRASIKDQQGKIVDEPSSSNDTAGIQNLITKASKNGRARAVVQPTGNM